MEWLGRARYLQTIAVSNFQKEGSCEEHRFTES
jgi:hypothetical protein